MRHFRLVLALTFAIAAVPSAHAAPFHPCAKGKFRCTTVKVPVDYDDPAGPQAKIAVSVLPARDQQHKLGPLFINYGGPGADAVASTESFGAKLFRSYRDRFDLVAVDPRGTGASRPALNCHTDQERVGLYRRPFITPDTADEDVALMHSTFYADRCMAQNGGFAAHVSTANVARDMDRIRRVLGARRITYFGFSYGTLLGATYAALFPAHIRAVVLDGDVDPQTYLVQPTDSSALQTAAFEGALDRYLDACRGHRGYCRWMHGRAPADAYDRLIARLDAHPIAARRKKLVGNDHRRVDGQDVNVALVSDLYAKQLWPEITNALNDADRGDGSLVRAISNYFYGRRKSGTYSAETDRYFMIGAAEQQYPTDPAGYFDLGAQSFTANPHFFFNS
ncbi:MAG: hypothetical protein QOF76_3519, partial [Solirubrobacteraceae bacterium]|nr:hypothetical protein [Solirubrobacteraceae bacterium]